MDNPIDLTAKIEILRRYKLFQALTQQEIETLAELLKEVHFKKGDTIVHEGAPVDSVFFIIEGDADVQHLRMKDGEVVATTVAALKANDAIGLSESGFYSLTGLRTATVVAKQPLTALRLSVAAFNGFALANSRVNEMMRKQNHNSNIKS